jgi:hypothetical protein
MTTRSWSTGGQRPRTRRRAGLGEVIEEGVRSGRLRATIDRDEAVAGTDLAFICVLSGAAHQPSIRAYVAEIGVADLCTFPGRVSDDHLCRHPVLGRRRD